MINGILIVDDEPGIRESLRGVLEDEGFAVKTAASGEECLDAVAADDFACILLDIWLGDGMDGLETLERLRAMNVDAVVVMISGHGNIETAVRSTKLGAFDFIEKPLSLERTVVTVKNAVRQYKLESINRDLRRELAAGSEMVGESVAMRALRKQISIVAPTDGRILISGESGTGKELVARAIHSRSKRAGAAFVEVNSAAIPEDLVESEFFGHAKGAFSGAAKAKSGKFLVADGGTLFLDEIGDMSARVQAKLLRVLEEQRFEPVGSNTTVEVDVRVISATNKPLDELLEKGDFRPDLFYRLNVIPFQVPPLRERREDVPILIDHFNHRFSADNGRALLAFDGDAIEVLSNYDWPGNVRELRNLVERLVILAEDRTISAPDLDRYLLMTKRSEEQGKYSSFKEATEQYQRDFIVGKLAEFGGSVAKAAEAMGVDRSHLYRRMRNLQIKQP